MKKYTLVFVLAALIPFVSADASEYRKSGYTTSAQTRTSSYKTTNTSRKNGGYRNVITNNFYYNQQPAQTVYYKPAQKTSTNSGYYKSSAKQTKSVKKSYSSQERKYFLAHPFFQPLKGKFGSVTDLSYAHNAFKFDMLNGTVYNIGSATVPTPKLPLGIANLSGKAETAQYVVKEDFSYGITDTLSIIGMVQYDKTKVKFKDWSDPTLGTDSKSDSGLNIFGIGLQNRFVDNAEWIAMASGYYQHQKDAANTLIGDLKVGYKIDRTTIYGLGRVGYSHLIKGNTYGMYIDDATGDYVMLSYKTNVDNVVYVEGGVGAFAVLNKYFTLNGEMIYGHYDWHQQLNIKGAIGWQPGDMFALNLYASTSLYDSAKGKTKEYMNYDVNPELDSSHAFYGSGLVYTTGDYKINSYNEWKIGIQGILYF